MKRKKIILLFGLLLLYIIPMQGIAQEISFTATVDRNIVPMGEYVMLSVLVSGNIARVPKPKLPKMKDFDILSQGSSRNISIVNGKISSSLSYNYTLVPKKVGSFTIGACEIEIKGKVYKSEPIEIEVVPESKKPSGPGATGNTFPPPFAKMPSKVRHDDKDLYITTTVNKKTVYTGEEIILTFRFYSHANIISQLMYYAPEMKGFWKEDIGEEKQYEKIINGKQYEIIELKYALFPIASGTLTIGKAQLNCIVDDFPGDPFGFSTTAKRTLVSDPISITVLPIPSAPAGFSGAVGEFTITAELDKDSTKQNEPVTVVTTIRGDGNLRDIDVPKIVIPGFKVYDSGSETELIEKENSLIEEKINKTIIVPFRSGDFEIPERKFTYFSPKKKSYVTKLTKKLPFKVFPGEGGEEIDRLYGKGTGEDMGKDIHFLKTGGEMKSESGFGVTRYFIAVNMLLFCLFVGIFLTQAVRERLKSQEGVMRKRNALRNALRLLKGAREEAKKGDIKEGYESIHKAILQYVADKSDLSVWGTTEDEITSFLTKNRVREDLQRGIFSIIEACNRARFSKETLGIKEFNTHYSHTVKLLKYLKISN